MQHQCDTCGKRFVRKSYLKNHLSIHEGLKPYTCHVCHRSFRMFRGLIVHSQIHGMISPYVCEYCGKAYKQKGGLRSHQLLVHLKQKIYPCKACRRNYTSLERLEEHVQLFEHAPFVCDFCGMKFKVCCLLIQHRSTHKHRKEYCYRCKVCGRGLQTEYSLSVHMLKHQKEKAACPCKECASSTNANHHKCDHGFEDNDEDNVCESLKIYEKHSNDKLQENSTAKELYPYTMMQIMEDSSDQILEETYSQDLCENSEENEESIFDPSGKQLHETESIIKSINNDLEQETPEMSLEADVQEAQESIVECSKDAVDVVRKCSLIISNMHGSDVDKGSEGQKRVCEICRKVYKNKFSLKKHMCLHIARETLPPCIYCGKTFLTKSYLKQHVLMHANEMLYTCEVCGKKFKTKQGLEMHQFLKHADKDEVVLEALAKVGCIQSNQQATTNATVTSPKSCSKTNFEMCEADEITSIKMHNKKMVDMFNTCKKVSENENKHESHADEHNYNKCEKMLEMHSGFASTAESNELDDCDKERKANDALKINNLKKALPKDSKSTCKMCGMRYKSSYLAKSHTSEHLDLCDYCEKQSVPKTSLKQPVLKRTGKLPYECKVCRKKLKTKSSFEAHVLLHTSENPYQCEVCEKRFRSKRGMNLHRFLNHTDKDEETLRALASVRNKNLEQLS